MEEGGLGEGAGGGGYRVAGEPKGWRYALAQVVRRATSHTTANEYQVQY